VLPAGLISVFREQPNEKQSAFLSFWRIEYFRVVPCDSVAIIDCLFTAALDL
jgi:hypothetical protein